MLKILHIFTYFYNVFNYKKRYFKINLYFYPGKNINKKYPRAPTQKNYFFQKKRLKNLTFFKMKNKNYGLLF